MTRFSRLAAAPALAGALILAPAVAGAGFLPAAVAHDAVVGSTPEDGAVLDTAPDRIELEFSANPQDTFNTIALSRDGEVLVTETPEIDGNVLSVDIPDDVDLTDGEYTVGFRITSSDGHPTEGSYTFTVDPGSGATQDATAGDDGSGTDDSDDDGIPGWAMPVLAIAGVLVLAGVLVMLIARLRSTDK
jgi:methionine-rich copper-binding protein CopC